jgi:hypothetical protein
MHSGRSPLGEIFNRPLTALSWASCPLSQAISFGNFIASPMNRLHENQRRLVAQLRKLNM